MSIKFGDGTWVMGMRFRLTHSSSSTGSISHSRGSIVAGGLSKLDRYVVNGEVEGRQVGGVTASNLCLPSFGGFLLPTHASSGTASNSSTISGTRRARSAASSSGDGGLVLDTLQNCQRILNVENGREKEENYDDGKQPKEEGRGV